MAEARRLDTTFLAFRLWRLFSASHISELVKVVVSLATVNPSGHTYSYDGNYGSTWCLVSSSLELAVVGGCCIS